MQVYVNIDEHSEAGRYFLACARIRDISVRAMAKRLLETISEDQLVASVLDDDGKIRDRKKREHRYFDPPSLRGSS